MMRLRTAFLTTLTALALVTPARARAQEPIRFARTPDISPDGKYVAFSYLGDIWVVETIGGIARPVTLHRPTTCSRSSAPTAGCSPSAPTVTVVTTSSWCRWWAAGPGG